MNLKLFTKELALIAFAALVIAVSILFASTSASATVCADEAPSCPPVAKIDGPVALDPSTIGKGQQPATPVIVDYYDKADAPTTTTTPAPVLVVKQPDTQLERLAYTGYDPKAVAAVGVALLVVGLLLVGHEVRKDLA